MDLENKKYDLEKAKEDCRRHEDALEEAQSCMCGHCHECGFDPSEMKAALDEVGRLRSENDGLKELVDCMLLLVHSEVNSYDKLSRLSIKALETVMEAWQVQCENAIAKDARIKEPT